MLRVNAKTILCRLLKLNVGSCKYLSRHYAIDDVVYGLTNEEIHLRKTIFNLVQKELAPKAQEIDKRNNFDEIRTFWKKLGDIGALGILANPDYGGTGGTYLDQVIILEEIARGSGAISGSYASHANLCVCQISRHGTEEQKRKYLPKLCSGEHIGALAMSEVGAGSDVVSMKLTAKKDGDYYILNGSKFWITNGPDADVLVVYAKTDINTKSPQHGISTFLVEKTFEGFSTGRKLDKLGLRGSNTSELVFENCRVPKENLMGKENNGIYVLMSGLDVERLVLGGMPVGLMQAACDEAFYYAHQRKQFGKRIGEFQMIQDKLAKMYTTLSASRSYLYSVARACDKNHINSKDCAGVFMVTAENGTRVALDAIQILATLCSEVSTREYEERMEILSKIHTHWQKHEQVVVGTPIETYEIPNNYDEPDQQLANSENIIDAPVAHSQNDEQVVVSTSIENYEIPNNYDEPDQQLANSENIMNAPVETNEVQGNKDTQTQAQQLENEKQEQDSLENIYLPVKVNMVMLKVNWKTSLCRFLNSIKSHISSCRYLSKHYAVDDVIYGLTNEEIQLRNTMFDFVQKELAPKAQEIDKTNNFDNLRAFWRKLGDIGALGITVGPTYGGTGGTYLDQVIILEEIARSSGGIATSYGAHTSLCISQISRHGTEEQKRKYLPKLCSGEYIGALAMTEVSAGSDIVAMKLTAKKDGDYYLLNGGKFCITNGPDADVAVVYAKTDVNSSPKYGISTFLVDKNFEGYSTGKKLDKLGMRGSHTSELIFENCKVPKENLLGKENRGVYVLMSSLDLERLLFSGIPVGLMQAACDEAFHYAHQQKQFGKRIGEFQMIQDKLAKMYTRLSASRSYLYLVARACDKNYINSKDCAGVFMVTAKNGTRVASDAIQILGANGYINDYPTGRVLRDIKACEIAGGTMEIRKLVIGRALNAEYS
ncbi:hypothetical protein FQA39_LY03724 [Lamprigera yunnana]|nr:hypothetical protein FQA39_LY03724 [Lamprigera yunnana]